MHSAREIGAIDDLLTLSKALAAATGAVRTPGSPTPGSPTGEAVRAASPGGDVWAPRIARPGEACAGTQRHLSARIARPASEATPCAQRAVVSERRIASA